MQTFDFQKFLVQLPNISRDEQGFYREIPIFPGMGATSASVNVISSAGTAPGYWDFDNDADELGLNFYIPLDYDSTRDELKLHLLAERSAGSGASTFTITEVWRVRAGEAGPTQVTTTDQTITVNSDTLAKYTIDLDGLGFQAGDVVGILLDFTRVSSSDVFVYGGAWNFRSSLVAFAEADAT